MTYSYTLIKNPKLIEGSETVEGIPINPETKEEYECCYVIVAAKGAWYTYDRLIETKDFSAEYWGEMSDKIGVMLGSRLIRPGITNFCDEIGRLAYGTINSAMFSIVTNAKFADDPDVNLIKSELYNILDNYKRDDFIIIG